jgi:hypothetical protein
MVHVSWLICSQKPSSRKQQRNSSPTFSTSDGELKRCSVIEKEGTIVVHQTHVKLALPTTPHDTVTGKITL